MIFKVQSEEKSALSLEHLLLKNYDYNKWTKSDSLFS